MTKMKGLIARAKKRHKDTKEFPHDPMAHDDCLSYDLAICLEEANEVLNRHTVECFQPAGSATRKEPKTTKMTTCKWCGSEMENDAGAYYHEHECWVRDVRKRIENLRTTFANERNRLQAELEQAEYVGD